VITTMNIPHTAKKWLEPAVAVLMSLATLSTTWSSYQSAAWTRQSNRLLNESNALERRAALLEIQGSQTLIVHTSMFTQMMAAKDAGNLKLIATYEQRLAPDMEQAYETWLAQNPADNPAADPHPFVPQLYQPRGAIEAAQLRDQATQRVNEARASGNHSGQFLANTVLFAAMTTKFEQHCVRLVTLLSTVSLFLFAASRTLLLPISP